MRNSLTKILKENNIAGLPLQELREDLICYLGQLDQMMTMKDLGAVIQKITPFCSWRLKNSLNALSNGILKEYPRHCTIGLLREQLIFECVLPFGNEIQPVSVQLEKLARRTFLPIRRKQIRAIAARARVLENRPLRIRVKGFLKRV